VFFDNLFLAVATGNIIEENHYYPFGLKIAAISSHKLGDAAEGKLSNPYLYNDKDELDENTTLSWYDYGFRNYDPQIGRFPQLDPLTDDYPELTPFQYASNDPIANIDVDGLEAAGSVGGSLGSDFFTGSTKIWQTAVFVSPGIQAVRATARSAQLAKIARLSFDAIKIAATVVRAQEVSQTLNKTGSTPGVELQIRKAVDDFAKDHPGLSDDDIFRIGVQVKNYFKGLNFMAFWARGDFDQLDRTAISGGDGHISDEKRVAIVQGGIIDEQSGFRGVMHEGANTIYFIASLGLFPEVGAGPRVNAPAGVEASQVADAEATVTYKSFTKSNYRYNLKVRTGSAGKGMDAHHNFPKKFRPFFERAGINIDDPNNLTWWESGLHKQAARAFNEAWSEFIGNNPNATVNEIETFGKALMRQYGFQ
jgi:RHS repeat-associated protein